MLKKLQKLFDSYLNISIKASFLSKKFNLKIYKTNKKLIKFLAPINYEKFSGSLTFLQDENYIEAINNSTLIDFVITKYEYASLLKNKTVFISNNPKYDFFEIYNYYKTDKFCFNTKISQNSLINRNLIPSNNIYIGEGTFIEKNVIIHKNVLIGKNVYIGSGSNIGCFGLEVKKNNNKLLRIFEDGLLIIEDNSIIGSNVTISRGFRYRNTHISNGVQIDNSTNISHSVIIKKNSLVSSNVNICGSVTINKNCWVGPSSTISNGVSIGDNTYISIGSVVLSDIGQNKKVYGNPARVIS